jgi:hypothetical protein
MPTQINLPSFNIDENNIQSSTIKYQNDSVSSVQNVKQMLDNLYSTKVTSVPGKGLSSNDFTDEYKNKIQDLESQLVFSTYQEFPNIGSIDTLYIDKANNTSYLWDPILKSYSSVTFDGNEVTIQSVL